VEEGEVSSACIKAEGRRLDIMQEEQKGRDGLIISTG